MSSPPNAQPSSSTRSPANGDARGSHEQRDRSRSSHHSDGRSPREQRARPQGGGTHSNAGSDGEDYPRSDDGRGGARRNNDGGQPSGGRGDGDKPNLRVDGSRGEESTKGSEDESAAENGIGNDYAFDLSGVWVDDPNRSDPLEPFLKGLGLNWAVRSTWFPHAVPNRGLNRIGHLQARKFALTIKKTTTIKHTVDVFDITVDTSVGSKVGVSRCAIASWRVGHCRNRGPTTERQAPAQQRVAEDRWRRRCCCGSAIVGGRRCRPHYHEHSVQETRH